MPRTIAVIGANGRTGKVFVDQALASGYKVRAGVYGNNDLKPHHNLEVYKCDSTDPDDVAKLLKTCQAVVSLIGHGPRSPDDLQTKSIQVVTAAMKDQSIKRLISLTGTAVKIPGDKPKILNKLSDKFISKLDPTRVKDGINHYKFLKTTDLDWTIIRVTKLTNQTRKNYNVKLTKNQPSELFTPRQKVCQAILVLLKNNNYTKSLPVIN